MKPCFIFPCDYYNPSLPDLMFKEQVEAIKNIGFNCHFLNLNEITTITDIKQDFANQLIIYRGWMLNKDEYQKLELLLKKAGGFMLSSTSKYLLAHHLPNWYTHIEKLTPKTVVFDLNTNFQDLGEIIPWDKFIIKDYVKSLKTSNGSIVDDIKKIPLVIEEMRKYKGTIEGGICIREFEEFLPETETRFFVVNGIPFGPNQREVPEIVHECCARIAHPFFSIDIVKTKDWKDRVVEIGDGQVSDFVGWDLNDFVKILQHFQ